MTLDLKNMPFGFLNPELTQRSVKGSTSRRRTTPDKQQSNHMASIATGDCLKDKLQYPGVVMSTRMTKFSRSGTQMAFRSPAEGFETQFKNYVYRVHMRDLMGYRDPTSLEDDSVHILTEARLDLSALSSLSAFGDANNNYDLTSRMVLIEFDNPRLFTGARIVSVGTYVDVAIFDELLQNKMMGSQAPRGDDQAAPGPFMPVDGKKATYNGVGGSSIEVTNASLPPELLETVRFNGDEFVSLRDMIPDLLALKAKYEEVFKGQGHDLFRVNNSYRDYAWQADLYNKNCSGGTCSPPTARPGRSRHGWGAAVDLSSRQMFGGSTSSLKFRWLNKYGQQFNFVFSVKKESWHLNWIPVNTVLAGASQPTGPWTTFGLDSGPANLRLTSIDNPGDSAA